MNVRTSVAVLACAVAPALLSAQGANPVADAFRANAAEVGKNLIAAAEDMPAAKYAYKPTAPQMTYAAIVVHLAQGNDFLCGKIAGVAAPERAKVAVTDGKDKLVARLKETFQFCDEALAKLDDSKLGEEMALFGPKKMTRAAVMTLTTGDWADHYSQIANYLRLNNLVPPTAKKAGS
jgi:uncharacterized damage-inducible protein DinB